MWKNSCSLMISTSLILELVMMQYLKCFRVNANLLFSGSLKIFYLSLSRPENHVFAGPFWTFANKQALFFSKILIIENSRICIFYLENWKLKKKEGGVELLSKIFGDIFVQIIELKWLIKANAWSVFRHLVDFYKENFKHELKIPASKIFQKPYWFYSDKGPD